MSGRVALEDAEAGQSCERGKAKPGDKTMVDALEPSVLAKTGCSVAEVAQHVKTG